MFNAFEEIFAPGRKHTDDERNRLALTRVDVADGDPGRGPIDLASGKVTVRAQGVPGPEDDVAADAAADAGAEGTVGAHEPPPAPPADAATHDAPDAPAPGRPGDGDDDVDGAASR